MGSRFSLTTCMYLKLNVGFYKCTRIWSSEFSVSFPGHEQTIVPNLVQHGTYWERLLLVGKSVWQNASNIEGAFDSLAVWARPIIAQTADDRRVLYGDCNIEDAGAYTPGIIPIFSTSTETRTLFLSFPRSPYFFLFYVVCACISHSHFLIFLKSYVRSLDMAVFVWMQLWKISKI